MKPKNTNAQFYLSNIKSIIANMIVFIVLFAILALVNQKIMFLYGSLVTFIGLSPFLVYYIYQYNYYQKIELSDVQVVKLFNIVSCSKKFAMFYVNLRIDGLKKNTQTKSVFSKLKYASTFVEPYIEAMAVVGYNVKRDEAVVIKIED